MAFFSKKKDEQIGVTDLNLPSHIGIIMDGQRPLGKEKRTSEKSRSPSGC